MPARSRAFRWAPALCWMVVIFFASTDAFSAAHTSRIIEPILIWLWPHIPSQAIDLAHFLVRKTAHFAEYGILGILLWRAVPEHRSNPEVADWWRAGMAVMVATFYAASDEYHQTYIPSRGPSVRDVVIDACGAAFTVLLICLANRQRTRRPPTTGTPSPAI